MQEVRHQVLWQVPILVEELILDVHVLDFLSILQFRYLLVEGCDALSKIGIWFLASRKHTQQKNFGGGNFFLQGINNGFHPRSYISGLVIMKPEIVGPDHNDKQLGSDAIEFTIGDSP